MRRSKYQMLSEEKRKELADSITTEICELLEQGHSSCVAIRKINVKTKVSIDTIYYILAQSKKYFDLVDSIKKERVNRFRNLRKARDNERINNPNQ